MRRVSLSFVLTLTILTFGTLPVARSQGQDDRVEWVASSLKEMQSIKVGMTRADLLKVFVEEGGLSTRQWRQYAYQHCPYFKVKVEFAPVGKPAGPNPLEGPQDKIVKISEPFIQWSVSD